MESHLHPFPGIGHGILPQSPQMDTLLELSNGFLFDHLPEGIGNVACATAVPPLSNYPLNLLVMPFFYYRFI
ncbi:MAG: hypothetical protein H0W62_13280 [Chitinophagales bacterium]|nr:hypothetical protein [Chitinophagales bacterium]